MAVVSYNNTPIYNPCMILNFVLELSLYKAYFVDTHVSLLQ